MMADSVELRMSVTSIKIVDPYARDILATSTHVALYKFNNLINEWEKTETEGALFVYSRNGEPFHSLMIVNRLSQTNLIEPIVKDFEYQMQAPFLLYRNSKSKIFGIWFYNREECVNITYVLESLIEGLKEKMSEKNKQKSTGNSVDIFSMLSKAQEDFNKTPTKADSQPQFSSTPRAPDVTSQSVMDFFAKASSKSTIPPVANPVEGEFLLQRLMSNPEHSVEHIEKQQRSITPQDQVVMRKKSNSTSDRRSVPISFNNSNSSINLEKKPENGFNFISIGSPQQHFAAGSSPLSNFLIQAQSTTAEDRASGTSPLAHLLETHQKPTLLGPMMFATSSNISQDRTTELLQPMKGQLQPITTQIKTPQTSQLQTSQLQSSQLHSSQLQSSQLHSLQLHSSQMQTITPQIQTPTIQTPQSLTSQLNSIRTQNISPHMQPITPQLQTVTPQGKNIEPLTKNQMIQAFGYLLKNDPEFVTKLHEAYVKSIAEMVQSNCSGSSLL